MVHYHLTNKNLSWAQVRGCRSTSPPFAGGGKGGRGVAALLRVHTLILLVFISKYFLKALRQQGAGGAVFGHHVHLPAGSTARGSREPAQTLQGLWGLSLTAPCCSPGLQAVALQSHQPCWTPAQETCAFF